MKKNFLLITTALLLSLLILFPIVGRGAWYPMHDTTHIARLSLMEQTIKGGQFPPIWAEGINNGYGYPLFHFYAPVFYYTALIAKLVAGTYMTGLKLALFFFIAIGIYGIMRLASRWGRGASLLAGTAFALSPYLALDLYVRGAFAETAGMMLFPWVLIAWEHLSSKKNAVTAGVLTSLFLTSHNLIPILAFPVLIVWILIHHLPSPKKVILPAILTLLISSFYWLPLIFERSFVQADQIARVTDYTLHFVYPTQIWNSTWGFGGSGSGIEDGLSFKMGKVQILLSLLGLFALLWKRQSKNLALPVFAVFTLYLSTILSHWLWDLIPFLAVIQFPWRYLSLAAALLAGSAGASLLFIKNKLLRYSFVAIALSSMFYFNYKYFSPQWTFNDNENRYKSAEYLSTITSIIPEFMPRWMPVTPTAPPADALSRAYYPTWRAEVNGQPLSLAPDEQGVIQIDSSVDRTKVQLTQSHTTLERFAYALTLLGLGLSLYLWRRNAQA